MSSLHILEKVLDFNNYGSNAGFINKLRSSTSIIFPSNVINYSLSIKDFVINNASASSSSSKFPVVPLNGGINAVGWGIEDANALSNTVFFTGWMEILAFPGSPPNNTSNLPEPNNSYLSIIAVAICE